MAKLTQKLVPYLWFAKDAEEAARFYASIFPDSRVDRVAVMPADTPSGPEGSVVLVELTLFGQKLSAMSAGKMDPFNHAVSFMVLCDTQAELDKYWNALLEGGGQPEQCGWIKDRFGLIWQITPSMLDTWVTDKDKERGRRVTEAMLKMVKLDIATLKAAYDGK
jgi:predicted 3-demethylubiquinone-9 3-methyltransferase (glyoxalase superfamily)